MHLVGFFLGCVFLFFFFLSIWLVQTEAARLGFRIADYIADGRQ